ncbi:MAG: RNA degradosome polyphosphate kinase [Rickettsiales bacterium]|nr:RNA degradosome polyphosphate kinase [Rickettsiales bacterium]
MRKETRLNHSALCHTEATTRYLNRELSWLAFNSRVLEEAYNQRNPLMERMRFLSISSVNLDEFTMVRVAGLRDQISHGIEAPSLDGLTPQQQLFAVNEACRLLMKNQQSCWLQLRKELKKEGVHVVNTLKLARAQREWLHRYFMDNLFAALTPIAVDPAHPFPFLPNLGLTLLFELKRKSGGKRQISVLPLPPKLPRFIQIPGESLRFVLLEDVIRLFLDALYPGYDVLDSAFFRIIRDSDLELEDEAEDLMRYYENALKQRRRGRVISIKALSPVAPQLVSFFSAHLGASQEDIIEVPGMIGLAALGELYDLCARPDLKYLPYNARSPERISDFHGDCFAAIQAKDIIIHHPFETFDVVVQFLRQAALDPDVVSIKQTLYRTSKDSPIIKALITAAENGKSVTALVELKARFDEEANIKWARDLERAGAQVVYGFVHLKTHAKLSLITRREGEKLQEYAHVGTGNYHPNTAKVYTDLSCFTCDEVLCRDINYLFNFVTGYAEPERFERIITAPNHMREGILDLINREMDNAKLGKPAAIWAKMNSLVDRSVIEALYEASCAGVHIDLVVRGICCLRPGVKDMSENIRVKSIIGRFLEHSRVFCFGNGHALPSKFAKVYIGSADWMPRNFDHRVEIMLPLENPTVHAQVLDQIMVANLRDNLQSWQLQCNGEYERTPIVGEGFSAHEYFMNNPSLSGRGKALRKEAARPRMQIIRRTKSES